MLATLMLSLLLASSSAAPAAADAMPAPGSYGFNWLKPSDQCKALDADDLASISGCEVSPHAFGLDLPSHQCKVSEGVELVVYDTQEHCQQAWETMQAHGD
jgi:hypothetical protein